jgi:hypothetical protein
MLLLAVLLLAGGLRLHDIRETGVVYQDDLRAYAGPEIVRAITRQEVSLVKRLAEVYRISIESTGARPALAWLVSIPAALGFTSIGDLFIPFALFGIIDVFLVWMLCKKWFDPVTAAYAALWMSVSLTHVNYSRSALPPTPAMAFMALGLVLMFRSGPSWKDLSWRRMFAAGWCLALSVAFHPAYLVYLAAPLAVLATSRLIQRVTAVQFLREFALYGALLLMPTCALIILYDAPSTVTNLLHGQFERSDLLYLSGMRTLSGSSTIYSGVQEGFIFWPQYVLNAEGLLGFVLIGIAIAGGFLLRRNSEDVNPIWFILPWLIAPYLILSLWPNLTSLGRLYAPLTLVLACLVGLGLSRITLAISRSPVRSVSILSHAIFVLLVLATGVSASRTILMFPGGEPALGQQMRQDGIKQAMGFVRTDTTALSDTDILLVYQPADIEQIRCTRNVDLLVLSPASYDLVLRHQQYLFGDLQLEPVIPFPNPYRVPARLMEGQTPRERKMTLTEPQYASLGLFRIRKSGGCSG